MVGWHHMGISEENGYTVIAEGKYADMLEIAKDLDKHDVPVWIEKEGRVWVPGYRAGSAKAYARAHIERRVAEWLGYKV